MKPTLILSSLLKLATPRARWARRIVIAVALYTIIGFFVVPAVIKWQMVKQLPKFTHREATVREVAVNPYALSLTINGLTLRETDGSTFAHVDGFYADFQLSSIFRGAWTFREVSIEGPMANIIRAADGQFNFANLLTNATPTEPKPTPKELPHVLVGNLVVTNAVLNVTDHTRAAPFRMSIGPTWFALEDFTTHHEKGAPYQLLATTGDGERFEWIGDFSMNPLRSAGEFSLRDIPIKKYGPYLADFTRAQVTDGALSVVARYRFSAVPKKPLEAALTDADVQLKDFHAQAPDTGEVILRWANLTVSNASANLIAREARVPSVKMDSGAVTVRRDADGGLNWLKLLVKQTNAPAAVAASATQTPAAAPWKLFVDEVGIEGFSVTAEDRVPPKPAALGFDDLRLVVKGFSNQSNAPVTVALDFTGRAGGTVHLEANGTLMPPAVEATVAATNLALAPLQPYVEQQANVIVNAGAVTSNGRMRFNPHPTNGPRLQFDGDTTVTGFKATDTISFEQFTKWNELAVRGIHLALEPNQLEVAEVKFTGLDGTLVMSSNGVLNLQALAKTKPGTIAPAAPAPTAGETKPAFEFPIKVGAIVLEKTSFHAQDRSITPRFNTSIEELNGTIRDFNFPNPKKVGIDLNGKVSALAPFTVTGEVTPDPKNLFVDMKLGFKNSDLTPFTPYSEKFAGYPLNKGKLSFDLRYLISERKLTAENVLGIDQLTFGARNQSTNATKLPVKLGVALLKDRKGRIDLNLPISGSLDDPKFSIGRLILQVVVNILIKAATSPFALLGSMFGGGAELQFVDFTPGTPAIESSQTNKLEKLTRALYERPALNLEISGEIDPATDRAAMTQVKLQNKLKTLRVQELVAAGQQPPALNELSLDETNYVRLLKQTYFIAFPPPTNAVTNLPTAVSTNAAPTNLVTAKLVVTNAPPSTSLVFAPAQRSTAVQKGGERLAQQKEAPAAGTTPPPAPIIAAPATNRVEVATATTATVAPPPEPTREEMEQKLLPLYTATDEELRELIQQRAQVVQKFLLDSGKVEAERLFLVAPKPVDPTAKGTPRVNFSLN